ncbi:HalOD1 output domain-containing protein [Halorussus gelatinilyticus]|uniref:HalOD1 output domain-containing protein n=1 Tax=Halorussus gelatinilyticus TaxID=2937524 RepID=UPI0034A3361A
MTCDHSSNSFTTIRTNCPTTGCERTDDGTCGRPRIRRWLTTHALFAPTPSGTARGFGRVVFTYCDHTVRVFSSGRIEIQPSDAVE